MSIAEIASILPSTAALVSPAVDALCASGWLRLHPQNICDSMGGPCYCAILFRVQRASTPSILSATAQTTDRAATDAAALCASICCVCYEQTVRKLIIGMAATAFFHQSAFQPTRLYLCGDFARLCQVRQWSKKVRQQRKLEFAAAVWADVEAEWDGGRLQTMQNIILRYQLVPASHASQSAG